MSKFDAFNTKGFDAFVTPGFDTRNQSCVKTTLIATGRRVWPASLPSSPSYSLNGYICFDSLGRSWTAPPNINDKKPYVYDAQGNLLFSGPSQSYRLVCPSDAGQGAAVMGVFDDSDPADARTNKIVCFNSEDASVKWTYSNADANIESISYANGIVFAGYRDHDDKAPGFDPNWPLFDPDPAPIINDVNPKWKTVALDALTGAVLGTAGGILQAVTPESGLVVLHNYDDFLPTGTDPITGLNVYRPRDFINYASDLSTVLWAKSGVIGSQVVQAVDVDETGTAWLLTADELISIDPAGVEVAVDVNENNAWSWGVQGMAVDLCFRNPRAFLRGGFFLPPNFTPRESTLQTLNLASPSINPNAGNFPSTLGSSGSEPLKINGKWSIFT